jgi:LysM repeat protein
MMCHQPVDSLPLSKSIFSGSWLGIGLGILIIAGIVMWVTQAQANSTAVVVATETSTLTVTFTPTPTPTATGTSTSTPTITPTPSPTPRLHVVESGDTLLFISQRYGVILDDLIALNDIKDARFLSVGQTLIIPRGAEPVGNNNSLPPQMVYVIKEGDTLSSIAFEMGTPMEAILAANPNLSLDLIYAGQEIIVPLSTPTPTTTPTPLPTTTPTPRPHYLLPNLLSPADGQVLNESTVLLNWTSTSLLADNEFYVVHLTWPDGTTSEHWVRHTSWHIFKEQRPTNGLITWTVNIKRQSGTSPAGIPVGQSLTPPGQPRVFEWR